MFERLKNFFLHGILATDEHLGITNPLKKRIAEMEAKEKENPKPTPMDGEDRKALRIAMVQVLGPVVLIVIVIIAVLLLITAKFFT